MQSSLCSIQFIFISIRNIYLPTGTKTYIRKSNCEDFPNCEYIGKTTRPFKDRLAEHRDYPKRDVTTEPSGKHFTKSGHNVSDLKGLVLEKVRSNDPYILKSREHMLIKKFDSYRNGLNQEP